MDRVVAVVSAPSPHAGLPLLPQRIQGPYWCVTLDVQGGVVPAGDLVVRRRVAVQAPPPPPPPQAASAGACHPGVRPGMEHVYAASGVTPQVRAAAPPPLADALEAGPRQRAGLASCLVAPRTRGLFWSVIAYTQDVGDPKQRTVVVGAELRRRRRLFRRLARFACFAIVPFVGFSAWPRALSVGRRRACKHAHIPLRESRLVGRESLRGAQRPEGWPATLVPRPN
jgi:hypothetical protein